MNPLLSHSFRNASAAAGPVGLLVVMACGAGNPGSEASSIPMGQSESALVLNVHDGADDVWSQSERVNITYCVSTGFGAYHPRAVREMIDATVDWEAAAYVDFIHLNELDGDCAYPDAPVTFTVESIFLGTGEAGAESFPPSSVHEGQFHWLGIALPAYDTLDRTVDQRTSGGAFRHELGHILGFRHEHVRPEATEAPFSYDCFDEPVSEGYDPWRTIPGASQYDPSSALHYGTGGCGPLKDFFLTDTDRAAAHAVYTSPTRCEVWSDAQQLAVTNMLPPASASDGETLCAAFAIDDQQRDGLTFSTVERQADHFRALMIESAPLIDSPAAPRSNSRAEPATLARGHAHPSRHHNGGGRRRIGR
jgi:hypothetical protein